MTKFADELFDDLMREHGPTLARTSVPTAPKRHLATRPVLLTAGAGALAVAATAGALAAAGGTTAPVTAGGTPAYALTTHPNGAVTLAVYQKSGIAEANAKLRQLGDDRVVVVPIEANCPRPPAPAVSGHGRPIGVATSVSRDGSVTVKAAGIPAGDILVVGLWTTAHGRGGIAELTSPPAPSCIGGAPSAPAPSSNG
jgi:hypothetical protein